MAVKVKKAKLAHEKQAQKAKVVLGGFTFKSVVELVEHNGNEVAIVDLDGDGTLGIVDRHFVLSGDDGLKPALVACPAVYDAVARTEAIQRHATYAGN
ncbi:MAG: hypothetical protein QF464_05945 [Myxococcota bacterium]|nr:hypothetical protein [Myxococcota bacterium]